MGRGTFLAHTRAQRGAAVGTDRQESRSVKSLLLTVERAIPTAEMDKKLSSDQKVGRQWPPQPLRLRRPCYTCDSGYELDGYQNRTCRITGTWTRYTPYCRRMKHTQINRNYITSTLHAHRKKCVHDSTLNNAQICVLTSQIIQVCAKQCSL